MKFGDRFSLVVGPHPYTSPIAKHFTKSTFQGLLACKIRPQRKNLERLIEITGIPEDWWLNGDGPPPPMKEIDAETADLVMRTDSKTVVVEAKAAPDMAEKMYALPQPSGSTVHARASFSRYVASEELTGVDGKPTGLDARTIAPAVSFVARILLVMQRQEWLPELDDSTRSHLVADLFNMLTAEAAGNDKVFDGLVESDGVIESGLRYLWEVQRSRASNTDSWAW